MMPSEANPWLAVRINKLYASAGFARYAKPDWLNPFGSVERISAMSDYVLKGRHGDVEQQFSSSASASFTSNSPLDSRQKPRQIRRY